MNNVGVQLEEYSGMICDVMCNKFVNACVSWELDDCTDFDIGQYVSLIFLSILFIRFSPLYLSMTSQV